MSVVSTGVLPTLDFRRYAPEAVGAFAFGLVIAFVVAATGHLGGAHINVAVTIGSFNPARSLGPALAGGGEVPLSGGSCPQAH